MQSENKLIEKQLNNSLLFVKFLVRTNDSSEIFLIY